MTFCPIDAWDSFIGYVKELFGICGSPVFYGDSEARLYSFEAVVTLLEGQCWHVPFLAVWICCYC